MARTKKSARKKAVPRKTPTVRKSKSPTVSKGRYYQHRYGSKRYLNGTLTGKVSSTGKFKVTYDNGKTKKFGVTKRGAVLVRGLKKQADGHYSYYYCTNRRDCKIAKGLYKMAFNARTNNLFNDDDLGLPL